MISNNAPRPRIAFIFNFITPYRVTFFEKLCSRQEYEWLIIHGKKDKEDGRPAFEGPINFPNLKLKFFEFKAGPFSIRWHQGVMEILHEWKPDIVITLGIPSMLTNWLVMNLAHQHGAKTITWHSGWEGQSANSFILPIKQFILKRYFSLVDSILVYSTKGSAYLSRLEVGLSEKITVCYNGLEIDELVKNENNYQTRAQILRNQQRIVGKKVFLYVGGISYKKQVPLLLQAFQKINNLENTILWIVGDGPDFSETRKLADALKLNNVIFWGRVIEDVDVLFAAADYFVLPGIGGLALNQALFWKLPCIVSEADGTEKDLILENHTGFYFTINDSNSLRIAMEKCLQLSDQQRASFGNAGRNLVLDRSNVNKMVETFLSKIYDLMHENQTPSFERKKN